MVLCGNDFSFFFKIRVDKIIENFEHSYAIDENTRMIQQLWEKYGGSSKN